MRDIHIGGCSDEDEMGWVVRVEGGGERWIRELGREIKS